MITNRDRKSVLALEIDLVNFKTTLNKITDLAENNVPSYVCFANVHMTIEAYHDHIFAQQVNNASFVLSDGMPLVKALDFFYSIKQDRIAGMDVMPDLIKEASELNLKMYFFGTTQEMLDKIKFRIKREYPNSQIVGMVSPPFNKSLDDDLYIDEINNAGAQLVFVALGCPKQERWMAKHSHKINAVLLGVGGAFPVYAGMASRAPKFMRNLSLEWLYRLYQEPGRLFLRYFNTNSLFLFLVIKTKSYMLFKKTA